MPTTYNQTIMDKRMLELIEILQNRGTIRFRQEFLDIIEMQRENFSSRKNGKRGFTVDQAQLACKKYRVNANWLFGIERKIFRD